MRTYIKDLKGHVGKNINIAGWVDVRRDHGKLIFVDIRDVTGKVQTVVHPDQSEAHAQAEKIRPEWVVEISGKVNKRPDKMVNPDHPLGDIEISIEKITVISAAAELPFDLQEKLNIDTYLDHLPLTLRTPRAKAIFTVESKIVQAYREFLVGEGFTEFQSPKIVGGDAEGGAGVFRVNYIDDHDAYLATSPQLYKQIMVGAFEKVFAIGNVFRAEKHHTTRHLLEYTSLDFEMGFIKNHLDVMNVVTKLMHYTNDFLQKNCVDEFKLLDAEFAKIPEEIPYMKLREAQELIKKETGEDCTKEKDLTPEHERWLSAYALKKFDSDFIFITHFPIEKTAFYAYEDENDPGYTNYFDLLFRGVELNSGGQRVHDYETLMKRMEQKGLDPEKFSFYLQAFKYGMPPHGGIGMGLERMTARFLNLSNVKEATLFPREINRIDKLLST
jgi:nondiscriminating aspartyl-tRNA synthetase|tara:strand:+ start:65545 stop:66873 length:1329 start_codon:yes stop_codon:yes gene_type:complete